MAINIQQFFYTTIALSVVISTASDSFGQPGAPASPVVVSKVVSTNQPTSHSFVGTLVPIRKAVIGSAVAGRVVAIHVEAGDPVKMLDQMDTAGNAIGQPIVQLRTVSLDIEIAAATVELDIRQNAERELANTLPSEIETAAASIDEIQARLKYSQADFERLKEVANNGGGITNRELEQAFSTYSSLRHSMVAAKSMLTRLTNTKEIRLAQAKSRVDAQIAELQRLRELRDQYTIRAPFEGYVTAKMTEKGQWVARGNDVVEIVQLNPIELIINVPQNYIGQLQQSLDECKRNKTKYLADVNIESLSKSFQGEIVRIVPQADLRSRSFPVIIRITNPNNGFGHQLKAGMLASANLFVGREQKILLVKKDALVLSSRSTSLYVTATNPEDQSTIVRPVSVNTGASIGSWIQVSGAVSENDLVVIEGNERLRPGQSVQIVRQDSDELPIAGDTVSDPKTDSPLTKANDN